MDKAAIKTFAVESRRKLMEDVEYRMSLLGITKDNIAEPITKADGVEAYDYGASTPHQIYDEDIKKRENLVREVKNKGFENVVEEVAYTWFNRIIAIRFMEVNDYLPTKTRVLSSETPGKTEPDIITEAFNIDLDYTQEDRELIFKLKDENKLDELFRFLFIKQCNKLNEILPGLFEKTEDYMELLLTISFTSEEGVVKRLVDTISEEDFAEQVEILGWMYQYYIFERKDYVINIYKQNEIKKEDIPAATQLFTTDWVVKYMVDNSLGKYWIERNPTSNLNNYLDYYLGTPNQSDEINIKIQSIIKDNVRIEELKFFDPCMGSGHILVYAFDVFMEIYKEQGYFERDIPELILKNNLYGLDIDKRAYQLSYFALMMKAREYDRKILKKNIKPNICAIKDSEVLPNNISNVIKNKDKELLRDIEYLINIFESGKEFGSLIKIKNLNWDLMESKLIDYLNNSTSILNISIESYVIEKIIPLIKQAKILSNKYQAVVTNPPYMNKFEKSFKDFANEYYKDYSKDLFSMFIYRNFDFCVENGYCAFITPFSWMFLKTYEKLREFILNNKSISSLIQLEYNAFTEVAMVPVGTFVLQNSSIFGFKSNGIYIKLSEFTGGMDVQRDKVLDAINNNVNYKYVSNSNKFINLPGKPIAYWVQESLADSFIKGKSLDYYAQIKSGISTGDNKRFLRYWFEVSDDSLDYSCKDIKMANESSFKWFPLNKGGSFCKWYGNQDYVINYENKGEELNNFKKATLGNLDFHFLPSLSWSRVTSSDIAFRMYPYGFMFDNTGSSLFVDSEEYKLYIFGFLNSKVCQSILDLIAPALHYEVGNISSLPLLVSDDDNTINKINYLVEDSINISRNNWNNYEISWNFLKHPFLNYDDKSLKNNFDEWDEFKNNQFDSLRSNEVEMNEIFSEIYSTEMDCNVEDKHISVNLADYEKDIKSFISYAVGCMFGRYSLDAEGLQFAGGEFDLNNYSKFIPDDDNIIPVLDTEYFEDDMVGRFVEFIKVCFGEETLEENLDFIAGALSKSNKSSREIIRDYLLRNFFKDHTQTYKKCPIYWMFSSGKQNGFNCLVYMHRYEPNLVARVRTDYLHKTQKAIEQNIVRCDNILNSTSSVTEKKKVTKEKNKLEKQLQETREYDEALAYIANQNIEIYLDDGVTVNYAKFQGIEVSKEGQKNKKVNLLKKI